MDDVRAVMDAVGSQRCVLLGVSEGGPLCSLFAATYPNRTEALVMIGSYARRTRTPDYPWAPTDADREEFCREILAGWGGPVGIDARAPTMARDPAFRDWWASYLRMGASPAAAVALTRMNARIDIRHVLPTIRVPTLVITAPAIDVSGSKRAAPSRAAFPERGSSSCPATIICRLSATLIACSTRWNNSSVSRRRLLMPTAATAAAGCWPRSCG